jgi:hypothetical protein
MPSTCTDWSSVVSTARSRSSSGQVGADLLDRLAHQVGGVHDVEALRLTTCSATVVSPLKRAVPVRSWKVRRISASSPSVTTRSPLLVIGRL